MERKIGMVIDFHTHAYPEAIADMVLNKLSDSANMNKYTDATVKGLMRSMALAGIDKSVILPVATSEKQTETINDFALRINETSNESGVISFGAIHPENADYALILKELAENNVKGIKIHPTFQGVNIDDLRYLRIVEKASELGLIVVTHAGYDVSFPGNDASSVKRIDKLLSEVRPDKMVLAHMGGWGEWERVPDMVSKYWVYLDTSFSFVHPDFKSINKVWEKENVVLNRDLAYEIIVAAGYNHIMLGSDTPWSSQVDSIKVLSDYFDESDLKMVLGGTAERILE